VVAIAALVSLAEASAIRAGCAGRHGPTATCASAPLC